MTSIDRNKVFIENSRIAWESTGKGVRRKILGYDPAMMMTVVKFEKGSIGNVHQHIHTQVTFVESGSFEVQIGGEKKVLSQGDCFFVPPHAEHGVVALEDGCLVDVFSPMRQDFLSPKP